MKKETNLTLGVSEPEKVDAFMQALQHPLLPVLAYLRKFILSINASIGEGIYWNAPTYFYKGPMEPFSPKTYKRYLLGFNFYQQNSIRIIFLQGATVDDPFHILEGDYKDGRRLMTITSMESLKEKEVALKKVVELLLRNMS